MGRAHTYQLRRYELAPQLADEFLRWVKQDVMPLRNQYGFGAEWMYLSEDKTELTWLCSYQGDQQSFLAAEKQYSESDERKAFAETMPKALIKAHTSFVSSVF